MKQLFLLAAASFLFINAFAGGDDKEKVPLTYNATYNGVSHIVAVGDTVHIGYGSNPYGSFMYIYNGSPPMPLDKQYAGKSGSVFKVKYIKSMDQYQIYIKGKFGNYIVDLPQAIDKGEITGFNGDIFK